ncbi:MAG: hypothetical protein KDC12_14315 [Flavobacteriales bacterium]|nr:hypothetical protein [Flavobacteriales bacterium]
MSENPFKIIEPREEVPATMKKEVMGSVRAVVLILRFVQLFVGDFTNAFIDNFKTNKPKSK